MEIKNDNKNMFDSLTIRRIRLARENKLTSDTVKILTEPLKDTIPYLGSFFYPLTIENFNHYWSTQEKKDKEDEIKFLSWKLGLLDRKLTASEKNSFELRNERFTQKYQEEEALLKRFENTIKFLNKLNPLQSETPVIYGEKAYCQPQIRVGDTLTKVEIQDWLEILDRARLSDYLPLVYGSIPISTTPYTLAGFNVKYGDKLLGLAWDQLSDLNIISEAYRVYNIDSEVLFNIRKKIRPNESIKKERLFAFVNADKIYKCTYELAEGKLYFEYPEDGTDILEILSFGFPNLDLGKPKDIGFRFTFKIFGLDLNNISFIHMIRTDDLLSKFLHLKENVKAFPEMEKPSFTFTGYGDTEEIKININPLVGNEKTAELIVMADKPGIVENFRQIFVRLMRYYLDNKQETIKLLSTYLAELPNDFKPQPPRFRKHILEIDESIRKLPNHRKPVILENPSSDYERLLKFPPSGQTKFYFTCSDDIYAFPSFKKDLKTGKLIPYCRRIEELTEKEIKNFDVEYPEIIEESKSRKKIISGDKELAVNFLGYVDPNLVKLLKPMMDKLITNGEILRMGNVPGFDSLIGCILLAVNDPIIKEPTSITTIRNIRREMALATNPIICKQENYLSSLEDIRFNLLDTDVELESKRYIRALENFFQVNIFIWEKTDKPIEKINFEIPYSKFFSVRRFNTNWPSILIYRHNPRDPRKNEMDPQYQLLINSDKATNSSIRIFDKLVTEYLIDAYYTSYSIYIWNNGKLKINPFISDYIKGGQPLGQILDNAGKCRGLVFSSYTLITPPVAPYNLNETSVQLATLDNLSKFGTPTSISVHNNLLVGLWFMDLYSPCQPVNIPNQFINLPRVKPGWLNQNTNTTIGFSNVYRNLRILMTIIRWLNRVDIREFENYRSSGKIIVGNVNYKVNNMGRRLPALSNFDEALTYIKDKFIGLVQGDNIVLPSLKILDHLDEVLQRADENWRKIPTSIPNFYLYASDFQNTLIFNLNSLDLALFGSGITNTTTNIPEELGPNPIVLKDENQLYLYYPLPGDNKLLTYNLFVKLRGLNVEYEKIKNSYVLYQISEDRKLVAISDHIEGKYFITLIDDGVIIPLL